MATHVGRVSASVLIGVGAAFDFHARAQAPGAPLDPAGRSGMAIPPESGASSAVAPILDR